MTKPANDHSPDVQTILNRLPRPEGWTLRCALVEVNTPTDETPDAEPFWTYQVLADCTLLGRVGDTVGAVEAYQAFVHATDAEQMADPGAVWTRIGRQVVAGLCLHLSEQILG